MDISFALLAFLFMLFFLSTIRAFINNSAKQTELTIVTSVLFGVLVWVCLFIFAR